MDDIAGVNDKIGRHGQTINHCHAGFEIATPRGISVVDVAVREMGN